MKGPIIEEAQTIREMEGKRSKNGKSKLVSPMSQHGRNDS